MEETGKDKVRTTVRMEATLHSLLSDRVHEMGKGLPMKEKPSIDGTIQKAVAFWLAAESAESTGYEPVLTPSNNPPGTDPTKVSLQSDSQADTLSRALDLVDQSVAEASAHEARLRGIQEILGKVSGSDQKRRKAAGSRGSGGKRSSGGRRESS